jgi:type I restriction enzyme S subunit
MVALGEIVDFHSGGTPSKSRPEFWAGDVPWFSAKDLKRSRLSDSKDHVSEEVFRSTPLRKVPAGTVAMVVRGMILAHTVPISILDVDGAINQDLKALLPKQALDPSYLAATLRAQHASILSRVSTAAHGTKKLDSRVLEEIRIPFPPLDEQRRIAAILDHADALRSKRRQVLIHLNAIARSVYEDMFGDIDASGTVGDVADIQGGLQVSAKRNCLPIEVPYLRVANVHRDQLDLTEIKTLRATAAEVMRTRLSDGDLLFVEGHANPLEIGRVAVWSGAVDGCVHQNHLIRARLDRSRILPMFASTWLNSARGAAHFRRAGKTTSGLNTISASTVRSAPIPIPPLADQQRFVAVVNRASAHRTAVQRALAADDELFASLQSRAFRGEL